MSMPLEKGESMKVRAKTAISVVMFYEIKYLEIDSWCYISALSGGGAQES